MNPRSLPVRIAAAAALLLAAAGPALAWPSCKEAVASQGDGDAVGRAYTLSVLGMLAMPFLLASTIGFLLWRASRAQAAAGAGGDGSPSPPPPPAA